MYVKEYCLCFPLRALIVSGLTFKSSIHFEFIFVYSTRKCPSFILLHVAVQFSWLHFLKRQSFLLYILILLDEAQVGIKIAGRYINNLIYADGTTLMAESEELKTS